MSPSSHSIRTLRRIRKFGGRYTIKIVNNRIVDSHPHGVSQNTIRAMRKHGYVSKVESAKGTAAFELTRKAYDLLDEMDWTPASEGEWHAHYQRTG